MLHRPEQVGPGGGQRVARLARDLAAEFLGRREREPVVGDQAAHGLAESKPFGRAGDHRQVDPAAGFVPRSKPAGGRSLAHRLARAPLIGELPIVDHAGPLRGQVRHQALLDQSVDQQRTAVLHQVRPVREHHGGPALARCGDPFGQPSHLLAQLRGNPGRRRVRVPRLPPEVQQVPPLRQGKDLDVIGVQLGIRHPTAFFRNSHDTIACDGQDYLLLGSHVKPSQRPPLTPRSHALR